MAFGRSLIAVFWLTSLLAVIGWDDKPAFWTPLLALVGDALLIIGEVGALLVTIEAEAAAAAAAAAVVPKFPVDVTALFEDIGGKNKGGGGVVGKFVAPTKLSPITGATGRYSSSTCRRLSWSAILLLV